MKHGRVDFLDKIWIVITREVEERNLTQPSKNIFKPKMLYNLFIKIFFNNHIKRARSCLRKQLFSTKFCSFLCLSWNAAGVYRNSCWKIFLDFFCKILLESTMQHKTKLNIERKSGGGRGFLGEKRRNRRTIEEKEIERRKNTNQEGEGECCRLLLAGIGEISSEF
ncbi:hypothetical protein M9H77_21875 [Catharanthus roseus]|uniref:Uncharacterized protein n=1 Tax=Catharanthus roseus TaxID=4058 RepID=A0ACC0ARE3_CATRO|nr:hypothetical protein M9H77_21875 [Catharanthus roseus]